VSELPRWSKHEVYAWVAYALAVVGGFAWLEWRGMRRRSDDDPTLTGVVSRYVPGWLVFTATGAFKSWLDWHFQSSYRSWMAARGEEPDVPR
jgi:hypothetical protein